jgi:ATP-binding protein involved in chromosome partitioning
MNESDVRELLSQVDDPDLGDDIVSLNLVNAVEVEDDLVRVSLALNAPFAPNETDIADRVREVLEAEGLEVELSASMPSSLDRSEQVLPDVKNIIAVSSGKGGVGKSTIAVNLAVGLSELGAQVGLFDADVYGPNVPRMLDSDERAQATEQETIIAPEKFGIKLMSMAYLVGKDDPVIWRGPMVQKVLTQLIEDVEWGELDYMVIDMPPGTGDTQLTVLQTLPLTGSIIVTTPQEVAVDDARKGLRMFGEHETNVLGVVENMSGFRCPDCGSVHDIFGEGGGKGLAEENDLPFLGGIPIDPSIRSGGDEGRPAVMSEGDTAEAFREMTANVANMAGIVNRRSLTQQ